jgi:hypothetical protein
MCSLLADCRSRVAAGFAVWVIVAPQHEATRARESFLELLPARSSLAVFHPGDQNVKGNIP